MNNIPQLDFYIENMLSNIGTSNTVIGLKRSGKSYLVRQIAKVCPGGAFIIDPMDEYGDLENVIAYVPTFRHYCKPALNEINQAFQYLKMLTQKPRVLIFDEVATYAPSKRNPPEMLAEFNATMGHIQWGMCAIYICQRPVQPWSNLIEMSDNIIAFRLRGRNDHIYLQNIAGKDVSAISYKLAPREHIFIFPDKTYQILPALGSSKVLTNTESCAIINPLDGELRKGENQIIEVDNETEIESEVTE